MAPLEKCRQEDLRLIPSTQVKSQTWQHALVFPAWERWRQEDSCGLQASQPGLISELQVPMRDSLKAKIFVTKREFDSWNLDYRS